MIRRPTRNSGANKKTLEKKESLIRQNSATIYGLYFASSNTDFLLDEKKTRFSLRPSVVVKQDRQTLLFDYSSVRGDEASIFDGFFRGLTAGGTAGAGSTLALDGGIESTCNFINDVTGIPLTNFADTYTISSIDVSKKIIVAIKANPITSTTAVMFESKYFIDLPQWTKTQTNKDSTLVNKIINLIPSQSMSHLGVFSGSILEFDRTSKNNGRFTVENVYNQNGFEVIDVKETVVHEDASGDQVIVSVYGEKPITQGQEAPPVLPAPILGIPTDDFRDCCPCKECLLQAIRLVQDRDNNCDQPGGPYRLIDSFDCKKKKAAVCQQSGEYTPPCRENPIINPACCALCNSNICSQLAYPCGGDANCCRLKKQNSELLIACEWRRYIKNPRPNCECDGPIVSGKPCCDCKNLALIFRSQCAKDPNDGAPGGMMAYDPWWEKVQKEMKYLCDWNPQDRTCNSTPPVKSYP